MDEDVKQLQIETLTNGLMEAIEQRDIARGILKEIATWVDFARSLEHEDQPTVFDLIESKLPDAP